MNIEQTLKYYYGITSLYHFTDRSNLKTIEAFGIQSLKNIFQQNIKVSRFGADDFSHALDRTYGLDAFVHLSFIKDHPMYHVAKSRGSIVDPVWLELDISVLFERSTFVSDKVANGRGAKICKVENIFNNIDFDTMLNGETFHERKEARKSEIIVKDSILTSKIIGVHNGY
jgi:hypothetical protein